MTVHLEGLSRFIFRTIAIGIFLIRPVSATPGQIDPSFEIGNGSSGSIEAVALDAQGRIIVAGSFTTFNGAPAGCIVRLLENGSVDPDFNVGTGANFAIKAIEILPDKRILLGGQFTTFGATTTRGLVLLLPNGTVDTTFTSGFTVEGFSSGVTCLESLPGGKLAVGGYFTKYAGKTAGRFAILTSSGDLISDTLQDPGASSHVFDIDVQADGNILLCGFFKTINGHASGCVARLLPGGGVDTSFSTGTQLGTVAYSVAGQADGKVIIGGNFSTFFDLGTRYLGRLTATGQLDTTFAGNDGPDLNVYGISVDSEERIVIAGQFTKFHNEPITKIVRLHPNGTRDLSFSFTPTANCSFVVDYPIDPQGRILAYGWPKSYAPGAPAQLVRLDGGDPSPLVAWRLEHFGTHAATAESAWDATPGNDGITNLEKYGLGFQGDPRTHATLWGYGGLLGGFWRNGTSSGFLYQTDVSRSDVTTSAKWSLNLTSWNSELIEITEESRSGTLVTWKASLPGFHSNAFFRVEVSVED